MSINVLDVPRLCVLRPVQLKGQIMEEKPVMADEKVSIGTIQCVDVVVVSELLQAVDPDLPALGETGQRPVKAGIC